MLDFYVPVRILELDELNYFVQYMLNLEVIILLFYLATSDQAQVQHVVHLELDEAC